MPPTTTTTPPNPNPHLTTLQTHGFLHLPSLLTPAQLAPLREAAAKLTALARRGGWPHVRTVGKQFPPWDDAALVPDRAGIWGVQHLLHPDLPLAEAERAVFRGVYFGGEVLGVVGEVLGLVSGGGGEEEGGDGKEGGEGDDGEGEGQEWGAGKLTMELFNMLVRPDGDAPFALRWHRDDIPASASADEERARLKKDGEPYVHTQWNLPLFDDDSLIVVPGSHARPRTDAERDADPYADDMPGQVTVALKAGDVVFYDNNILHRGVYDPRKERMTLHGSVGNADASRERARNVLQHGVGEWVDRCDFKGLGDGQQRRTAEGMRRRLVELGRENQGRDVGYSLEG
jgi:hypothetical protein